MAKTSAPGADVLPIVGIGQHSFEYLSSSSTVAQQISLATYTPNVNLPFFIVDVSRALTLQSGSDVHG